MTDRLIDALRRTGTRATHAVADAILRDREERRAPPPCPSLLPDPTPVPPPADPLPALRSAWNTLLARGKACTDAVAAGEEGAAEEFSMLADEARDARAQLVAALGRPLTEAEESGGFHDAP